MKFSFCQLTRMVASTMVAVIMCLAFWSCSDRGDTIAPYGWSRVQPEFDSLTWNLERLYILQKSPDSIEMFVRRLREIADRNPGKPLLNSRATFWEGRCQFTKGDYDQGIATMTKALMMTDSASHPFDFHRIMWNIDMDYHAPSLERYEHLTKEYAFFRNAGDDVIAGALGMELGVFMIKIGDAGRGIRYLNDADSLFIAAGFPDQVANNRINHADAYAVAGDTARAVADLRKILSDTVNPVSSYARNIAVGNLYNYVRDTVALCEAYAMVKDDPKLAEATCMYENFLTEIQLNAGRLDSAVYFNTLAASRLPEVYEPTVRREFLRLRSGILSLRGMPDSAYLVLKEYSRMNDSIHCSDCESKVRNMLVLGDIRQTELQNDLRHRRAVNTFLLVVLIVIVAGGGAAYILFRRLKAQRRKSSMAKIDRDRSERRVNAMQVVLEEKENLIDELEGILRDLDEEGDIPKNELARLRAIIRAHSVNKESNDSFIESQAEIDPQFSERLLKDFPALTASDLRLASLVVLGMEIKHIARVMSIRPESVKQARWRLRSKMGLGSGESLEQALRKYAPHSRR